MSDETPLWMASASDGLVPLDQPTEPGEAAEETDAVSERGVANSTGSAEPAWSALSEPRAAPAPASSADRFTDERMLRARADAPRSGWRRLVWWASGGRLQPPPSKAERRHRELVARVKTPAHRPKHVVVCSRKGGVGKTTTALMAGSTLASIRGDRVLAIDGNPDAGSLAYRVRRETTATVTDLLADHSRVSRYADVRGYTSQAPSRLEVLASDDDPGITVALRGSDYAELLELCDRFFNVIVVDTGTGILDSGTQGILARADQLVVVCPPAVDGARVAAATLDWLEEHGRPELVSEAVVAINAVRRQCLVDVEEVEEHFADRCRATVRIPFDRHLEAGAETYLPDLAEPTRQAYLELAAAIADGFAAESARKG